MNLTRVTLTGADESIDPGILVDLSAEFPFVEWGILVGSRAYTTRFPGTEWVEKLIETAIVRRLEPTIKISLHICGHPLRDILERASFAIPYPVAHFQRCQLNFHGVAITEQQKQNAQAVARDWSFDETIVQLDGVNDSVLDDFLSHDLRASGLYDRSHGAGAVPGDWPQANPKWKVGYAGGLGPENLAVELARITDAAGGQRFWIDMETQLRNERDVFDERLVRAVLSDSAHHFAASD